MSQKTILIVDNDQEFLSEIEDMLKNDYQLICTTDPLAAIQSLDHRNIDLAVMDLQMPGKTGFELAYEFTRNPRLQHVPIIAVTGFYKENLANLLNICGIKQCLRKPFHPLDLIRAIDSRVNRHETLA